MGRISARFQSRYVRVPHQGAPPKPEKTAAIIRRRKLRAETCSFLGRRGSTGRPSSPRLGDTTATTSLDTYTYSYYVHTVPTQKENSAPISGYTPVSSCPRSFVEFLRVYGIRARVHIFCGRCGNKLVYRYNATSMGMETIIRSLSNKLYRKGLCQVRR